MGTLVHPAARLDTKKAGTDLQTGVSASPLSGGVGLAALRGVALTWTCLLLLSPQDSRMQSRWLLRWCLWVGDMTLVWSATFKIALIGPWSCDPMFSRAMPTAAANLALSRIQSDGSLSRGYRYSVQLLEEDCSLSKGQSSGRSSGSGRVHMSALVPSSSDGSGGHRGLRPRLHRPLQPAALRRRRLVR